MGNSSLVPTCAPKLLLGSRPSTAGALRLSANSAPEHQRPVLLREFSARLGVRYDVEPVGADPIRIDLTLEGVPGIQLFSGQLQGARYTRTRESNDPTEDIGLLVNPRGAQLLVQRRRELVLGDGDAALVSLTEPLHMTLRPPGDFLVLRVPRPQLAPCLAAPQDCVLHRIPYRNPGLRLLMDYVNVAWEKQKRAERSLQGLFVSHVYDLMAAAIGATRDAAHVAQGRGVRVARLQAIKQDIARNLGQPDLSLRSLAARHHCTPRFVQRLFEMEGSTLTGYMLAQRLVRAHRMLSDPRRASEKIGTVAYDCGFSDLSYFNRAFRRHFGATPSDVRAPAQQAASEARE